MTFKDLEIIDPILRSLQEKGYTQPTPIQEQSIPILLSGKDLLGCAQTGTGKTAAFSIPILQNIYLNTPSDHQSRRRRKPGLKALIVTPTRELAIQIGESLTDYGKHTGIRNTVIFGGVKQGAQTQALQRGTDILVATPGRLLDLISQGFINLREIEYFVLDEADRMLDMGFIHDVRKIINLLPSKRQSLFFSATMAPEIVKLSGKILGGNPGKVTITPRQNTAEKVDQSIYYVDKKSKSKLLVHLMEENPEDSTLVFSRTKHGADKIVKILKKAGINALAIHGNKSQGARQKALGDFKSGEASVLVATDIAARGIDVSGLGRVINYDLPNIPETYVHRIGRTGRANAEGTALSFCDVEEKPYLKDIQKLINQRIPVIDGHPFLPQPDTNTEVKVEEKPLGNRKKSSFKSQQSGNRYRKQKRNRNAGN
ncbi:DEAD/DEAH box helicase [Marinilabilia salmonicolor]|jgi:ATP-dependent RNA helicase RhlE|uniref:ATP-dependent RNA helicase RhlE n=1 Tax=Marinilabilia salmonicolor TaxID=989 RepID=A0A2T0XMS9_9BACT|nr:DEAD/DEAH box helicase [Marinilabilia salmonicolor]PRZ00227.1 ATP-dependent RNA helicase RhlE [Marinilabilia salmonicolor]RCW38292.1 ATP-dependent RNA helicase RhlE [Marinilabilia salmonicolor]